MRQLIRLAIYVSVLGIGIWAGSIAIDSISTISLSRHTTITAIGEIN